MSTANANQSTLNDLLRKALDEVPDKDSDWFKTDHEKVDFLERLYKALHQQMAEREKSD
jgi:hypothetical protein